MTEYFSELKSSGKVKIQLDLLNCGTKTDLKMPQKLIHNIFLKQVIQLVLIASNAGKLDFGKLKNVRTSLSNLES